MEPTDAVRPTNVTKSDINNMNFVKFPFELALFSSDQQSKVDKIHLELSQSAYRFSPSLIAELPKGKGAVRPGSILTLEDQLAYSMLVENALPQIRSEISPLQGVTDFGYQLYPDAISDGWFRPSFNCWDGWKQDSLRKIDEGAQFVVVTDITGCYENIDIKTLMQDLQRISVPEATINLLRQGLKSWGQIDTKGIPQGVSASHMLAKLYLSQIDVEMRNSGYVTTRYVDDIRIFCNSIAEARKALMLLTSILRKRGLNVQSSKSKILQASDAIPDIRGQADVIDLLQERLIDEVDPSEIDDSPYSAQVRVNTHAPNTQQLLLIKQAFVDYYLQRDDASFDKSLFHYLLNKLGAAHSDFAVAYSLDILDKHPEETAFILGYLGKMLNPSEYFDRLLQFVTSPNSVYDYQNFLICEWLLANGCTSQDFLLFAREFAFDNNKPVYYRTLGKQILGKIGQHADLVRVKDAFVNASSLQEKEAIICILNTLSPAIRNSFYNGLGEEFNIATSYARQLS